MVIVFDFRKVLQVPKVEEMEVTGTTQLENPIVSFDHADTLSSTQTHPGDALDSVCRMEDCDDDDSEDSDRYLHTLACYR